MKKFVFVVFVVFFISLVSAIPSTPPIEHPTTISTTIYFINGTQDGIIINWLNITNFPASCPAGQFVVGIGSALTCGTPSGFNLTYQNFAYNQTYTGGTFNITYQNFAYNQSDGSGGNSSFNQSFTDTLYSSIIWGYNQTYTGGTFNITYQNFAYNQTSAALSLNNDLWNLTGNDLYPRSLGYEVGIGMINPQNPLDVNNTAGSVVARFMSRSGFYSGIDIKNDIANQEWILATTSGIAPNGTFVIRDGSNNNNAFAIQNNTGNIGIGTTSPNSSLHIKNNIGGASGGFIVETPSVTFVWLETDGAVDNKRWDWLVNNEQMRFRAVNDANSIASNYMTIDRTATTIDSVSFPNGNIGIGTATPSTKLNVVGNVNITNNLSVDGNLFFRGLTQFIGGDAICLNLATNESVSSGDITCLASSVVYKQNITNLSNNDLDNILKNITATPIVKWRYNESFGLNSERFHIGLLAEQSPLDIRKIDSLNNTNIDGISTLVGYTWAGIKAMDIKVDGAVNSINASIGNLNGSIGNISITITNLNITLTNLNGTIGNLANNSVPYTNAQFNVDLNGKQLKNVSVIKGTDGEIKVKEDTIILDGEVEVERLIKLKSINLPNCNNARTGTIARNANDIYYCNGNLWRAFKFVN